jgi:hypothetical protein
MHLIAAIVTYFVPKPGRAPRTWAAAAMIAAFSQPTTAVTSAFAANTASPTKQRHD